MLLEATLLLRWMKVGAKMDHIILGPLSHRLLSSLPLIIVRLPSTIPNNSSSLAQSNFHSLYAFALANTGSHTLSCVDQSRFSWCFSKRRQFLLLRGILVPPVRNKLFPPFRFTGNVKQTIKICEQKIYTVSIGTKQEGETLGF